MTGSETFNFVDVRKNSLPIDEINSEDFIRLILTGRFEAERYQRQLINGPNSDSIYSIRRSVAISSIIDQPKSGVNRFLISSDLGNGKSIFLGQLSAELMSKGYVVVEISSGLQDVFSELDRLLGSGQPTAYIIDDVIRYRAVAEYIGKRLNTISLIACCLRGDPDQVTTVI